MCDARVSCDAVRWGNTDLTAQHDVSVNTTPHLPLGLSNGKTLTWPHRSIQQNIYPPDRTVEISSKYDHGQA